MAPLIIYIYESTALSANASSKLEKKLISKRKKEFRIPLMESKPFLKYRRFNIDKKIMVFSTFIPD